MYALDNLSKKLQVKLASGPASTELIWTLSYAGEPAWGATDGLTNGTSLVDMVLGTQGVPGTPVYGVRKVATISVFNADTANATVHVIYYNGTAGRQIISAELQPGYTLHYQDAQGWYATDTTGAILEAAVTSSVSLAIGDPITGGESYSMLYVDPVGDVAQVAFPMLPAFGGFVDGTLSNPPGSPADGDTYLLLDASGNSYSGMLGNIEWQSGTTVRYNQMDTTAMLAYEGVFAGLEVGATMKVYGATNPLHNGSFTITAWDSGTGYVEVLNPAITDASNDEAGSPGLSYFSPATWDGASFNDWVRYNGGTSSWDRVSPVNGQTVLNTVNQQTYVYKNNVWTSQVYVPPAQDNRIVRNLYEGNINPESTADMTMNLTYTGAPAWTLYHVTEIVWTSTGGTVVGLDDIRIYSGAGRTGNYLFLTGNAALLTIVNDGQSYISLSDGDVQKQTKTFVPATVYLSVGTINGGFGLTNMRIRIYGVGVN